MAARRGHGDDSIYWDESKNRYVGAISLGWSPDGQRRIRRKVRGRTKTEVRDKLRDLRGALDGGVRPSARYTVQQAVDDWLEHGLDGRSLKTLSTIREVLAPVTEQIGKVKLHELTAADVRMALAEAAKSRATRTVQAAHSALVRAITYAQANDLVARNVAALIQAPKGQQGRPSKSLTLRQAQAVLTAAEGSRLHGYIALCLLTGCRTEEARALRWDHVDLEGDPDAALAVPPHVDVWRSVRLHGDTKTEKSRRSLKLPGAVVEGLRDQKVRQARERLIAGQFWEDHGLVFASEIGTPLDAANIRRAFKKVCENAGIGTDWTPRELRHTFVSLMSESGIPVEEIARLVGHSSSRTTEVVYRKELRPVITTGAETMDKIFRSDGNT